MLATAPIALIAYRLTTVCGTLGMQTVTTSPSLIPMALKAFSASLICGTSFAYVVSLSWNVRATWSGYLRALSKSASLIEKSG